MAIVMDMCSGEWFAGPSSENEADSLGLSPGRNPELAAFQQYAALQLITQHPVRKFMPIELTELELDVFFLKMDKYFD